MEYVFIKVKGIDLFRGINSLTRICFVNAPHYKILYIMDLNQQPNFNHR